MKSPKPFSLAAEATDSMWKLLAELFPIHRTLVNRGFRESLERIQRRLPIGILEYPSGTKAWDWTIPNSWDVKEAYIEDSRGRRLVDFRESNLRLAAYSAPFTGKVSREELIKHLCWIDEIPDAIPFSYHYYDSTWEFCVAKEELSKFTDETYFVRIDVETGPGKLLIGEGFLPGREREEILLSTYLCHPSLANDNLSGVVVATEVFRFLAALPSRHYSYRLLILPETIGAITWLAFHEEVLPRLAGGYVLTCCGDGGALTYKPSFFGNALVDRAMGHVLAHENGGKPFHRLEYIFQGSDERQYNAPGVRIPVGCLMRTPYTMFPEYHTSKDDLSFVGQEWLADTAQALLRALWILEQNETYENNYRGEPFLSGHGIHVPFRSIEDDGYINQILVHLTDGTRDLLSIAEAMKIPFSKILPFQERFVAAGLARPIDSSPIPSVR